MFERTGERWRITYVFAPTVRAPWRAARSLRLERRSPRATEGSREAAAAPPACWKDWQAASAAAVPQPAFFKDCLAFSAEFCERFL